MSEEATDGLRAFAEVRPRVNIAELKPATIFTYEFGIRLDQECFPALNAQIALKRSLYNQLVACLRQIHSELQETTLQFAGPRAIELAADVARLSQDIDKARALNDTEALKKLSLQRSEAKKTLFPILLDTRRKHALALKPIFSKVGVNSNCATYVLRSQAVQEGLGWATANAVLNDAIKAWKASLSQGQAPRFVNGESRVTDSLTLQFTERGGLPITRLFDGKCKQINLGSDQTYGRRHYHEFKFRLGNLDARSYATGTWQYHRPLPKDSTAVIARIIQRRIGNDNRHSLHVVVKLPRPLYQLSTAVRRNGLVSLHFGWASDITGRRIAGIASSPNPLEAKLLQLPPVIEKDLQRAAKIQSLRYASRDHIVSLLRSIDVEDWPDLPREFYRKLRQLPGQNVALARLHCLYGLLRDVGYESNELKEWRAKDLLLRQDFVNLGRRARNRRRDYWRVIANNLVTSYAVIAIEPLKLKEKAQKVDPKTGKKSELLPKARAGRVMAGIYELEECIRWACQKTNTPLLEIEADTVASCAVCGGRTESLDGTPSHIYCAKCNVSNERKFNGAARAWQIAQPLLKEVFETHSQNVERSITESAERHQSKSLKRSEGRYKARTARSSDVDGVN